MHLRRVPLDRALALTGAAGCAISAVYVVLYNRNPLYFLTVVLGTIACITWLRWSKAMNLELGAPARRTALLGLLLAFSVLFTLSLIVIYMRPELYVRPLIYFVLFAVMAGTTGTEILLIPPSSRRWTGIVLVQLAVIALSGSWTEQLIFPSVTGSDPAWHLMFTYRLLEQGRIPQNYGYSSFPVFHLTTAAAMLFTGMDYMLAALFSVGLTQIPIEIMLIYLFGKFLLKSGKAGLLGALMLVTADYYLEFSWSIVPNTLAAAFLLLTIYVLMILRNQHPTTATFVAIVFGFALVLTHTVTAAALALILLVLWAIGVAGRRAYLVRATGSRLKIGIPMLFSAVMLGWWAYAFLTPFATLADVIQSGFSIDAFYQGPRYLGYQTTLPLAERIFDVVGFVSLFAFALIGSLYLISTREPHLLGFAIIGLTLLMVGFVSLILGRQLLNERWLYYAQILLALPTAVGVLLATSLSRKRDSRRALVVAIVVCLSFVMVMDSTANPDNATFSPGLVTRKAFTTSELAAARFLSYHWDGSISTDFLYGTNPSSSIFADYYGVDPARIRSLDSALVKGDFTGVSDLVVIRSAIIGHPLLLAGGLEELSYNPGTVLTDSGFSKLYDCGSVAAYGSLG